MIVSMVKAILAGPKLLAPQVIALLQEFGRFHISSEDLTHNGAGRAGLTPEEQARKNNLEHLVQELDGLLHLLNYRGPARIPDQEPCWDRLLEEISDEVECLRSLVRQRLELKDEWDLNQSYRSALEALSPLLGRLEKSSRLGTFGFVLRPGSGSVWDSIRKDLRKLCQGRVEFHYQEAGDGRAAALVVYHVSDGDKIRNYFSRLGINELKLPSNLSHLPLLQAVAQLRERSRAIPRELEEIKSKLDELAARLGPDWAGWRDLARDILARLAVKQGSGNSRFTFIIAGYLPQDDLPRLQEMVARRFGDQVAIQTVEIDHHEAARAPVALKNPKLVKPFELMLSIFNPPRYGHVDPTPFIAVFFPAYFGFIVGDLGYGLSLLLIALVLRRMLGRQQMVRAITTIAIYCALWTSAFGLLFGEIFGDLGEHLHWIKPLSEKFNRMSPEAIMNLFWIAVITGLVQVAVGYGIMFYTGIKHRDRHHLLEPLAFVLGIAGVAGFAASWMFHVLPPSWLLPSIIAFLVGAGLLGWLAGIAGPIEIFGAVGNILSFARLFAIGLSAAYLAYAANLIGRTIGGLAGILVAALVIHPLFFALGLISPIMQPFRLQVVEFFTKFKYHDYPGQRYQPFKSIGGVR